MSPNELPPDLPEPPAWLDEGPPPDEAPPGEPEHARGGKGPDLADLALAGRFPDLMDGEPMVVPPAPGPKKPAVDLEAMRVGVFMGEAFDRMAHRANGEEKPIPLPWPRLAELLGGGLWPGLAILVGNTGSGKSQLALQAALAAAQGGTPVLYIGLELDRTGLVARLLGLLHGCWWSDLYLGKQPKMRPKGPETSLLDAIRSGEEELARIPLHLDFCPPMGWSYPELFTRCAAMREAYPEQAGPDGKPTPGSRPFLVVLDFLQIVASDPDKGDEALRERIGGAAYAGRAAARELDAAVVLVSSTARDHYNRLSGGPDKEAKDKRPAWEGPAAALVGLGKESGEIEYAADAVLVLCREPQEEGNAAPASLVHVAVAKVRAGRTGWAHLTFDGAAFGDGEREWSERSTAVQEGKTAAESMGIGGGKGKGGAATPEPDWTERYQ